MLPSRLPIALGLGVTVACLPVSHREATAVSVNPVDSAVYAAVLDTLYARETHARIPVAIELLPVSREYDTPATRDWLSKEIPTVSEAMFATLTVVAPEHGDVRGRLVAVPGAGWIDSTVLMTRRDVSVIRYGIRLSRVAYSADSSEAVVYAVVACGAVCGSADYILLRRESTAAWSIRKVLRRWTG
jgi:hypothetical protein